MPSVTGAVPSSIVHVLRRGVLIHHAAHVPRSLRSSTIPLHAMAVAYRPCPSRRAALAAARCPRVAESFAGHTFPYRRARAAGLYPRCEPPTGAVVCLRTRNAPMWSAPAHAVSRARLLAFIAAVNEAEQPAVASLPFQGSESRPRPLFNSNQATRFST